MTQKEKIKHERILKLKKIGFWTLNIVSYILAGFFLIVLIISLSTPKKQNVTPRGVNNLYQEQITEVINDTPNNVVYDDTLYKITLSDNELNNYIWNNLVQIINNESISSTYLSNSYFSYNSATIDFNELIIEAELFYVSNENYQLILNLSGDNNFSLQTYDSQSSNFVDSTFEYNIVWQLNSNIYNDIKTAIELDIQANETSENQTIFESISQVLTNFITTLNSGITSVLNLFWNSTTSQLTLLGNLSTIVIGVAVCFFLFRLVIGLIRLRG